MVKQLGKEGDIDRAYYDTLVDTAATDISRCNVKAAHDGMLGDIRNQCGKSIYNRNY